MYKGVFTALITPFNTDKSIDFGKLEVIVEEQIAKGVSGLVPMGTTGESPTLDNDEHLKVISTVVQTANKRVAVIAGTGSNCTHEAKKLTNEARERGADASLQVAPYYNKPNQEGLYSHFSEIADSTGIPLIVYNIPGRTGKNIETRTIVRLANHPQIIGVKEASGDLCQMMDVIDNAPADFSILSGDDNIAVPLTLMGGSGVVSVASNIIPGEMTKMINSALDGNITKSRELHYKWLPFFKAMFLDTNPIPVKAAMALQGKIEEVYRLPLCPAAAPIKDKLKKILSSLGLAG